MYDSSVLTDAARAFQAHAAATENDRSLSVVRRVLSTSNVDVDPNGVPVRSRVSYTGRGQSNLY